MNHVTESAARHLDGDLDATVLDELGFERWREIGNELGVALDDVYLRFGFGFVERILPDSQARLREIAKEFGFGSLLVVSELLLVRELAVVVGD